MTHVLAAAGGDPLLNGDVDLAVVLIVAFKVVFAFAVLLVGVMLMIWFERKLIADMQNRIGPNVAGPWGVLQTLADGIKLFFKEDLLPERADLFVFRLAPLLAMVPAFVTFTVVPLGGVFQNGNDGIVHIFGHDTYLQVADPPIGILLVLAMSSIAVYGVMLAGWSSGRSTRCIGSVRASAQMVSLRGGARARGGDRRARERHALDARHRSPSRTGFVELELHRDRRRAVRGLPHRRDGRDSTARRSTSSRPSRRSSAGSTPSTPSIRFALFYLAEFMNVVTMSAIIVTLFFGGPRGPAALRRPELDLADRSGSS